MGQQAGSCCAELRGATTQQCVPGPADKVAVHAALEDGEPVETFDDDENAREKADRPVLPPRAGLAGAAVASPPSSVSGNLKRVHSRHSRLASGSQLEVDEDIIRAVSLATTLRSFGRAWRVNPQHLSASELSRLWDASQQADSIDIFVSHTWSTPGHQKYTSLLLSSYWHYALGGWIIAAISVGLLYTARLLPLPYQALQDFDPNGPVDAAPWIHVFSPFIALFSLVCAPYISSNCSSTTSCFLDVVFCILFRIVCIFSLLVCWYVVNKPLCCHGLWLRSVSTSQMHSNKSEAVCSRTLLLRPFSHSGKRLLSPPAAVIPDVDVMHVGVQKLLRS